MRWDLAWTIGPTEDEVTKSLLEKIKSKMDVAKVLGGVVVAVFTFLVQQFLEKGVPSSLALLALLVIAAAAALYFAALFSYDSLLMPSRFWGGGKPSDARPRWLAWRPPSSRTRVLQQNMLRTWNLQFVPATWLLALGLLLIGTEILRRPEADGRVVWDLWPEPALGLAGMVTLVATWIVHSRPRLGVED